MQLTRDRAAPVVDVRDQHPEGPLPEPGHDHGRLPVSLGHERRLVRLLALPADGRGPQRGRELLPDPAALTLGRVVPLALDDVGLPVLRSRDPLRFGKEEGLLASSGAWRYLATRARTSASDAAPFFSANASHARLTGRELQCAKTPPPTMKLRGL